MLTGQAREKYNYYWESEHEKYYNYIQPKTSDKKFEDSVKVLTITFGERNYFSNKISMLEPN